MDVVSFDAGAELEVVSSQSSAVYARGEEGAVGVVESVPSLTLRTLLPVPASGADVSSSVGRCGVAKLAEAMSHPDCTWLFVVGPLEVSR